MLSNACVFQTEVFHAKLACWLHAIYLLRFGTRFVILIRIILTVLLCLLMLSQACMLIMFPLPMR